jgi:hypothetical protein
MVVMQQCHLLSNQRGLVAIRIFLLEISMSLIICTARVILQAECNDLFARKFSRFVPLHPGHCYVALHQTTLLDNVTLSVFLMSSSFWRV